MATDKYFGHDVYTQMIFRETALQNKQFPCEKTPQNVFYLKEILDIYPNGRVINMIRDPRAVMLSQKENGDEEKWALLLLPNGKSFGCVSTTILLPLVNSGMPPLKLQSPLKMMIE
ncbi:MAG: sulfotransferase [Chitinophagales bacterium]